MLELDPRTLWIQIPESSHPPINQLTRTELLLPWGFPGHSAIKNLPAKAGDVGSIPGLGIFPGGHIQGNGNPFQNSCLRNPMDGGAWWAAVHGVEKNRIRLSDQTITNDCFPTWATIVIGHISAFISDL